MNKKNKKMDLENIVEQEKKGWSRKKMADGV